MNTENLTEMVTNINTQPTHGISSEYDIHLAHMNKEEEFPTAAEKESLPGQELQVTEKSDSDIELHNNYQPATEEVMINYINALNVKLGEVTIVTHWQIGQTINRFYQGKYGTNELGKISTATGIGRDTLAKACKFAKQYSKENLETLLKGNFVMSWYQISQHLTVEAQKVIETYQQSPDPKQFYCDIIKLKSLSEARGKSKPSKIVEVKDAEKPIIIVPEIVPDQSVAEEYEEPNEVVDTSENAKHYKLYLKELALLKQENDRLKNDISAMDAKIMTLEKELVKANREREKYDDLYCICSDRLDKVKKELENRTPAKAIIEWMENGYEEG